MIDWLPLIPFVGSMAERRSSSKAAISITRIVEALIIAGAGGAFSAYITTVRLSTEIEHVKEIQVRIESDLRDVKALAWQTRETQLKVMDARGVRLDSIDHKIDVIERKLK